MKSVLIERFFAFLLSVSLLVAGEFFKFIKTIHLEASEENIFKLCDISTDENHFYVLDPLADFKIKIYDKRGIFLKESGRKGRGPGEFVKPRAIYVSENRVVIAEKGIYAYEVLDKESLQHVYSKFPNYKMGLCGIDIFLKNERLITSDWGIQFKQGMGDETFHGIVYDLKTENMKFLWHNKYWKTGKIVFSYSRADVAPDGTIYLVYNPYPTIRVYTPDGKFIKEKEIKNPHFIAPTEYEEEEMNHFLRNWDLKDRASYINYIQNWSKRYSWVQGVFATKDKIFVFVREFNEKINGWKVWYTVFDGDLNLISQFRYLKNSAAGDEEWLNIISPQIEITYSPDKKYLYLARYKDEEGVFIEVYEYRGEK